MQIVIDIDEEMYKQIITNDDVYVLDDINIILIENAIANGTTLPKGHGDLIDRKLALSDAGLCEFHRYGDYVKMRNYLKSIPTIIEADKE
jgi:hypothetical protein